MDTDGKIISQLVGVDHRTVEHAKKVAGDLDDLGGDSPIAMALHVVRAMERNQSATVSAGLSTDDMAIILTASQEGPVHLIESFIKSLAKILEGDDLDEGDLFALSAFIFKKIMSMKGIDLRVEDIVASLHDQSQGDHRE